MHHRQLRVDAILVNRRRHLLPRRRALRVPSAGGNAWRSNRVDFSPFSPPATTTRGRFSTATLTDRRRHLLGRSRDPSRSVLERQFRPKHLLGLIPLVFVIAGGLAHRESRPEKDAGADGVPKNSHRTEDVSLRHGPLILKPQVGPVGKVGGALSSSRSSGTASSRSSCGRRGRPGSAAAPTGS